MEICGNTIFITSIFLLLNNLEYHLLKAKIQCIQFQKQINETRTENLTKVRWKYRTQLMRISDPKNGEKTLTPEQITITSITFKKIILISH